MKSIGKIKRKKYTTPTTAYVSIDWSSERFVSAFKEVVPWKRSRSSHYLEGISTSISFVTLLQSWYLFIISWSNDANDLRGRENSYTMGSIFVFTEKISRFSMRTFLSKSIAFLSYALIRHFTAPAREMQETITKIRKWKAGCCRQYFCKRWVAQ